MIQVTGLPIEHIAISVVTLFFKDHIQVIISSVSNVVRAEFDRVNRIFLVVGVEVADDQGFINIGEVRWVCKPIHQGFSGCLAGQIAIALSIAQIRVTFTS